MYVRGNRVRVSRYLRQYFCSLPYSFPTILCSRQPKGSGSEICERKSEPGLKEEICFMNLEMSPQGRCVWEGNGTEKKEFVERGTWNRPDRIEGTTLEQGKNGSRLLRTTARLGWLDLSSEQGNTRTIINCSFLPFALLSPSSLSQSHSPYLIQREITLPTGFLCVFNTELRSQCGTLGNLGPTCYRESPSSRASAARGLGAGWSRSGSGGTWGPTSSVAAAYPASQPVGSPGSSAVPRPPSSWSWTASRSG